MICMAQWCEHMRIWWGTPIYRLVLFELGIDWGGNWEQRYAFNLKGLPLRLLELLLDFFKILI